MIDVSPQNIRRLALLVAIAGILLAGLYLYFALRCEVTGKAYYITGKNLGRFAGGEIVMRESSPDKFRKATNLTWGISLCFLTVSVVSFIFYRKIDDCWDEPF